VCKECGCDHDYDYDCGCGCGSEHHRGGQGHMRRRRFLTKAEKIERLQNYIEELKKELAAVQERIKDLKS